MKNLKTPLGLIGVAYLTYGLVMNVRMFTEKMWPTYLFFISIGIGILFLTINKPTKKLPNFRLWQIVIGLIPITAFYVHMKIREYHTTQVEIAQSENYSNNKIKNGDIIFQTSKSNQSKAIQLATNSKYSHMGIIYKNGGKYFVFEATQLVKLTPLQEWKNRGENGHYVIKRIKNSENILTNSVINKMKVYGEKFKGKHYDIYFEWSDDKIYCSELVWKIYKNAANVEVGELERLSDFDLSSKIVQNKMKERYGEKIPLNEKVISPAQMFDSNKLITIEKK